MADRQAESVTEKMEGVSLADGASRETGAGFDAATDAMATDGAGQQTSGERHSPPAGTGQFVTRQREQGTKGVTGGEPVLGATGSLEGHKDSVTSLHMGGEGRSRLVSGSEDGTARVWDLERRRAIRCFTTPKDVEAQEVMSAVSGEAELKDMVAVARGHSVALFDLREAAIVSSKAAMTFAAHQDEVSEVTMDEQNALVAAADDSGGVLVYDIRAKKILRRMESCHSNICSCVRFRPGHRWQLVTGGLDGKVVHWSFNKVKALHSVVLTPPQQQSQQLVNPRFVYAMASSGGPDDVVVGMGDGSVALIDVQRGVKAAEFEAFPNMISALSFAPFGASSHRYLLAGGSDAHVLLSRVPPQQCLPPTPHLDVVAGIESENGVAMADDKAGGCARVLSLRCTSQVNAVASTAQGSVFVGDQGNSILTFDLSLLP